MSKLVVTYENSTITTVLTFLGEEYTLTMPPYEDGSRTSLEPCFETQFEKRHPDDSMLEEITDVLCFLSSSEYPDDEIEEALDELNEIEKAREEK